MELMLKLPKGSILLNSAKESITETIAIMHQEKKYRTVAVVPDVDPV
jgi:primosomal protein N' (replication factor Y)